MTIDGDTVNVCDGDPWTPLEIGQPWRPCPMCSFLARENRRRIDREGT